jgi:hypothetical protein
MTILFTPRKNSTLPAWIAAGLFLLAILPTLSLTRLLDVDEVIHARAALEASRDGHWLPLTLAGQPWWEKPPLFPWLGAATMKLFGPKEWCLRLWPALAGAGCAYNLARLGLLLAGAWGLGLAAALFFLLQPDFLFHARFFTMDTWLVWCLLAALRHFSRGFGKGLEAAGQPFLLAGLWLALAAAAKSYFAFSPLPVFAYILWQQPAFRKGRARALAQMVLPPVLMIAAWLGLYTLAYGREFLAQEWRVNFFGRIANNITLGQGIPNYLFYFFYTQSATTTLLPLAPLLWVRQAFFSRHRPPEEAAPRLFLAYFCGACVLGLLLVRTQHENYLLPLTAALCLCLATYLAEARGRGEHILLLAGSLLSFLAVLPFAPMEVLLLVGILVSPLLLLLRKNRSTWALAPAFKSACLGLLLTASLIRGGRYFLHLPDPNGPAVEVLLQNPAPFPGATLQCRGRRTESYNFYGRYHGVFLEEGTSPDPGLPLLESNPAGARFIPATPGAEAKP